MKTDVWIEASRARSPRWRASGAYAVRQTGPQRIHLVGAAQTPLGGDEINVAVTVRAGARLELYTVAATIALSSVAQPDSLATWTIVVEDGGELIIDPQPTIVAADAWHTSVYNVDLAANARCTLTEFAHIGRVYETLSGAGYTGRLNVTVDSVPMLRHSISIGENTVLDDSLGSPRRLLSTFTYPDDSPEEVDPQRNWVRMAVAATAEGQPGTLVTELA